jgi:hypothetical protein
MFACLLFLLVQRFTGTENQLRSQCRAGWLQLEQNLEEWTREPFDHQVLHAQLRRDHSSHFRDPSQELFDCLDKFTEVMQKLSKSVDKSVIMQNQLLRRKRRASVTAAKRMTITSLP